MDLKIVTNTFKLVKNILLTNLLPEVMTIENLEYSYNKRHGIISCMLFIEVMLDLKDINKKNLFIIKI